MIKIFAFWLVLLMPDAYANGSTPYRYSRDVNFEGQAQQVLLAVPLDNDVYAGSAADFSDLRLIDRNGGEIPYTLQKIGGSKSVTKRLPLRTSKPIMEKSGDEGIVIFLDLEQDETADVEGLTVVTDQRDFEYELDVQGAEDGSAWQTLADKAAIYDYSRFMNFGNRDVELLANNDRRFKITVAKPVQVQSKRLLELTRSLQNGRELQREEKIDIQNQPLHIERIELWRTETETVAEAEWRFEYPLAEFEINQDSEKHVTWIDVDANFLPLNGLELKVSTPNFSRNAEVQISQQQGIETRMSTIGRATVQALHFQELNKDETSLYFPEQRRQQYRIVIHNQDNPPLQIDKVVGLGPRYQLLFLPEPDQSYRLVYGADKAQSPHYEMAPIQELLRRGYQSTLASLGPEAQVSVSATGFDLSALLDSNGFLILVIILMVLVLGWSLYRLGKKVA